MEGQVNGNATLGHDSEGYWFLLWVFVFTCRVQLRVSLRLSMKMRSYQQYRLLDIHNHRVYSMPSIVHRKWKEAGECKSVTISGLGLGHVRWQQSSHFNSTSLSIRVSNVETVLETRFKGVNDDSHVIVNTRITCNALSWRCILNLGVSVSVSILPVSCRTESCTTNDCRVVG